MNSSSDITSHQTGTSNNSNKPVIVASLPRVINKPLKLITKNRSEDNNKQQESKSPSSNSNSFIRTSTLPRRFKEKFLSKYSHSTTASESSEQTPTNNSHHMKPSTFSTMSVNSQSSSISNSSSCSASSSASELTKTNLKLSSTPPSTATPNTANNNSSSSSLKFMHAKQLHELNKCVDKFAKAIKYLEQIILKKKYEIIASSITAILETVLDIYNVIQAFDTSIVTDKSTLRIKSSTNLITNSSSFKTYRTRINGSLANMIKWSDSILFLNSTANSSELFNETKLHESAKRLINQLAKSIRLLVKYLNKFFQSQESWIDQFIDVDVPMDMSRILPDAKLDVSCSTTSSSTSSLNNSKEADHVDQGVKEVLEISDKKDDMNNDRKDSMIGGAVNSDVASLSLQLNNEAMTTNTVRTVDEKNGDVQITQTTTKTTSPTSKTQITQTTTLTTTTSMNQAKGLNLYNNNDIDPLFDIGSSLICNPVDLSSFVDLDRLVLELSSLNSTSEAANQQPKQPLDAKTSVNTNASGTGFTNDQCNYLVKQFESFAKDFQRKEIFNDSSSMGSSSVDRNTDRSCNRNQSPSKKATVYTRTVFKHNKDQAVCTTEEVCNGTDDELLTLADVSGRVVSKLVDYKSSEKENFKEKNVLLNDRSVIEILEQAQDMEEAGVNTSSKTALDIDPVQTFTSLFCSNPADKVLLTRSENQPPPSVQEYSHPTNKLDDSVDDEEDDDGNINDIIFGTNKLNPNFILIEDDDDEDIEDEEDNVAADNELSECERTKSQQKAKRLTRKNFLVDDDDINDYNDTIGIDPILMQNNTSNKRSLMSAWSLSSTSDSENSSSDLEPVVKQCHETDKNADKNLTEQLNPSESAATKPASPIYLAPAVKTTTAGSQSLSSTSSSFSSLSCPNAIISQQQIHQQSHNKSGQQSEATANNISRSTVSPTLQQPDPTPACTDIEKTLDYSVLNLLDVLHLIEYQVAPSTNSNNTSTSTLLNNTTTSSVISPNSSISSLASNNPPQNTNILRGGHVDALIVLATSAQTGVSGAQTRHTKSNNNNSSIHNLFNLNTTSGSVNSKGSLSQKIDNTTKNNFLFQEAFLTTYRTIIEPVDLINKLIYRYRYFSKYNLKNNVSNTSSTPSRQQKQQQQQPNSAQLDPNNSQFDKIDDKFDFNRIKMNIKNNRLALSAAKNSLALLVRVLDDLGNEMNEKIVEIFADFVYELLLDDELQLARLLRKKLINKLDIKRLQELEKEAESLSKLNNEPSSKKAHLDFGDHANIKIQITPYLNSYMKAQPNLLCFKSVDLAEQMTLIDLNLFLKIELSEVLLWSTKQNEEFSPNLIQFTEHFNNISYWARSRILEHSNPKEREKYIIKFLKIMKHLRKINNFNSYLSLLSAVDSGPIQRLDWPKSVNDSIKEFSTLIDPKCGFKSLREAVNEAQPPCIPHIGLILQDLTILHIANSDYLPSGNCNFWKRWQQFNILERLRYFRRCNYDFKKNSKIDKLFNNFKDYFNEDAQYSLSEQLKPKRLNR